MHSNTHTHTHTHTHTCTTLDLSLTRGEHTADVDGPTRTEYFPGQQVIYGGKVVFYNQICIDHILKPHSPSELLLHLSG